MNTAVSLDLRENFEKEVKEFVNLLQDFLSGKGNMPATNTEVIKKKYIELGTDELTKKGTVKNLAKRVSKHTFDSLLNTMVS